MKQVVDDAWTRDTGLLAALVLLVAYLRFHDTRLVFAAAACILCVLFVPALVRPLAWVWLQLTKVLAAVMNPVFFGLMFFIVIVPMGLVRRFLGRDSLQLRSGRNARSMFHERSGAFSVSDMRTPF